METPNHTAPDPTADDEIQERERFIVLLRRGISEGDVAYVSDDESLAPEGHARMKAIALGLERLFPKANAIYTSPLKRASQTALWVSRAYRSRISVTTTEALAPTATTADFMNLIASVKERRAIIVGHEPNLSENLRALLGEDTKSIELKKGGCYGVRMQSDGSAVLEWLLPPRVLKKLVE